MFRDELKVSENLVRHELAAARRKFPSNKQVLHAFTEECGEVTKAFLDLQQGKAKMDDVKKEIVQAIAMGFRLLEEGDPEFPEFVAIGEQTV